jgi:hypothetical protein
VPSKRYMKLGTGRGMDKDGKEEGPRRFVLPARRGLGTKVLRRGLYRLHQLVESPKVLLSSSAFACNVIDQYLVQTCDGVPRGPQLSTQSGGQAACLLLL